MTIYKVTAHIYYYWMNGNEEGFKNEVTYYLNRENAERLQTAYNENPYWMDYNNEPAPITETKGRKGYIKIEEIHTED